MGTSSEYPGESSEVHGAWRSVIYGHRLDNSVPAKVGLFFFIFLHVCGIGLGVLWTVLIGIVLIVASLIQGEIVDLRIGERVEYFASVIFPWIVLSLAAVAMVSLSVKAVARLLWCGTPEPWSARLFALIALVGRIGGLVAVGYSIRVWLAEEAFLESVSAILLLICLCVAWVGLGADWLFVRTLSRFLTRDTPTAKSKGPGAKGFLSKMVSEAKDVLADPKRLVNSLLGTFGIVMLVGIVGSIGAGINWLSAYATLMTILAQLLTLTYGIDGLLSRLPRGRL